MSSLKETALLERIAELTRDYENKVADLRVVITETSQHLESVVNERNELQKQLSSGEDVQGELDSEGTSTPTEGNPADSD